MIALRLVLATRTGALSATIRCSTMLRITIYATLIVILATGAASAQTDAPPYSQGISGYGPMRTERENFGKNWAIKAAAMIRIRKPATCPPATKLLSCVYLIHLSPVSDCRSVPSIFLLPSHQAIIPLNLNIRTVSRATRAPCQLA